MTELGEDIKKLIEMMRPTQRTINNNLRDLLSNIAILYDRAQEEHLKREERRNILNMPAITEISSKRPHEGRSALFQTPEAYHPIP